MPTGAKYLNQSSHAISICAVLRTSSTPSRLGARAVRNIELVTPVAAIATHIREEPIRRMEGPSGFESESGGKVLMNGEIVPPLPAVLDGVNCARIASAVPTR